MVDELRSLRSERRRRRTAQSHGRQSGLGCAAGVLAGRLAARVARDGAARLRGGPLSRRRLGSEDGRAARAHAGLGPLSRLDRVLARRQDDLRDDGSLRTASAVVDRPEERQADHAHRPGPRRVVRRRRETDRVLALLAQVARRAADADVARRRTARTAAHECATLFAQLAIGEPEQFTFAGANGDTVHGYAMRPANFDPKRRYPVAFIVHGGPQVSFGNQWSYRWNPQTYAGRGLRLGVHRLPRLARLRPGVHRFDQRRLGRQAARRSAEGSCGRAGEVPVARRRASVRARRDPTAAS